MSVAELPSKSLKNLKQPYTPPSVQMADDVILYANLSDTSGGLCVVMNVHNRALDLMHLQSRRVYAGVRHRGDPDLVTHDSLLRDTGGCWGEAPKMVRIRKLEEEATQAKENMKELSRIVGDLSAEVKRLRKTP